MSSAAGVAATSRVHKALGKMEAGLFSMFQQGVFTVKHVNTGTSRCIDQIWNSSLVVQPLASSKLVLRCLLCLFFVGGWVKSRPEFDILSTEKSLACQNVSGVLEAGYVPRPKPKGSRGRNI